MDPKKISSMTGSSYEKIFFSLYQKIMFEDWTVLGLINLLGQILALYLSVTCHQNQKLGLPMRILYGFFAFVFGWIYVFLYVFFFYAGCMHKTKKASPSSKSSSKKSLR